jgi:hypothetical protein
MEKMDRGADGVAVGATTRAQSPTKRSRTLAAALVCGALALLSVAPAASASIQHEFAKFSDCPMENPEVVLCIVSTTTSGEFKLGSKTVPITKPVILQGGLTANSPVLVGAADGNTLSKTALQVPGGIVGVELLPPLTEVTATSELAGPVEISIVNANTGNGVAAVLPMKVKLDNPALGATCYVGSNAEPLTPNLTTGTTNPPPPNTPISGSPGETVIGAHGQLFTITNSSLVDNAFAAPGANGCAEPLSLVVDPSVDLATGLPSAAGNNTAVLNGTLAAASVTAIQAQELLPELGRCVKAPSEKVEKTTIYHGGYVASDCVEKNEGHFGKFEWLPGPGAGKKFTGASKAVTLETTGKKQIKCTASSSKGEYTGTKTATLGLSFTGCKLAATGESCQTSEGAPGELVTGPLEAQLGFIKDVESAGEVISTVGWDLKSASAFISGACGASKQSLVVTGSVIGAISAADKFVAAYTLKFSQTAGKQLPEAFEEEPSDTLSAALGGAPAEQLGLKASEKITNEEKLEFKAQAET